MRIDFWERLAMAPADGAAAAAAMAGAGDGGQGGTPPASGGDGGQGDGQGGGASPKWFEGDAFTAEMRDFIGAKGWADKEVNDVLPAMIRSYHGAEKLLGAPRESLLQRPKDGQDVSEWIRSNADVFGIPKDPDGYEVKPPKDWPKDAKWNSDLEAAAKTRAHQLGLTPAQLQGMTEVYAQSVARMSGDIETQLQTATAAMMADLQKDWGEATEAKVGRAAQAAQALATQAGFGQDELAAVTQLLATKTGDARTIRLFAALADAMGDDGLPGGQTGSGGGGGFTTPETAKSELDRLTAPGGEYYEATQKRDRDAIKRLQPRIEALTKAAAGKAG